MNAFLFSFNAVGPILLLILLGMVVRKVGSWKHEFYVGLNRLCFYLFLPVTLFCNIYEIEHISETNWKLVSFIIGWLFLYTLISAVICTGAVKERKQRGVLIQAALRPNQAVLGISLAKSLGGERSYPFAALMTGLLVPLYNVLSVLILSAYAEKSCKQVSLWGNLKSAIKKILTNPLIIGSLAGITAVLIREIDLLLPYFLRDQVPVLYEALSGLQHVSSPVLLFTLGAELELHAVGRHRKQILLGIVLRLILAPVLILGSALLLQNFIGLTEVEMPTLISTCASPAAASSVVTAMEMGGDEQLASQLVMWTSVFSIVTIFSIVVILSSLGVL